MATVLVEGFDKYGPPGLVYPSLEPLLNAGGWSVRRGVYNPSTPPPYVVPSLNGVSGYAIQLPAPGVYDLRGLDRTLNANYSRLIGGFRFSVSQITAGYRVASGWALFDGSTAQCAIVVQPVSNRFLFVQGDGTAVTPVVLQTSTIGVADNTEHFLEFDITIGTIGGWTVWLDGMQILNGTGNTQLSGNPYCNVFSMFTSNAYSPGNVTNLLTMDDLYLFDDTTSYNNSVLLSNPIVQTDVAIGDHTVQFTNQGYVFGNYPPHSSSSTSIGANTLYLVAVSPNASGAAAAVEVLPTTTSASVNIKGVMYADNGGVPGSLLSDGVQVTGLTANVPTQLPLASPPAFTAGTSYWIGFYADTTISFQRYDGTILGKTAANTYTSGAPLTAPAMTPNVASLGIFVTCNTLGSNWQSEGLNPPIGDQSSVTGTTAGVSDLYIFPALPTSVAQVYTVGVTCNARMLSPGTRMMNYNVSSSGTLSAGSAPSQGLTTTYAWYASYFDTDPHTTTTWSPAAVAAAYAGMSIVV